MDEDLYESYTTNFGTWKKANFDTLNTLVTTELHDFLRRHGVYARKHTGVNIAKELARVAAEEEEGEWTQEEIAKEMKPGKRFYSKHNPKYDKDKGYSQFEGSTGGSARATTVMSSPKRRPLAQVRFIPADRIENEDENEDIYGASVRYGPLPASHTTQNEMTEANTNMSPVRQHFLHDFQQKAQEAVTIDENALQQQREQQLIQEQNDALMAQQQVERMADEYAARQARARANQPLEQRVQDMRLNHPANENNVNDVPPPPNFRDPAAYRNRFHPAINPAAPQQDAHRNP